MQSGIVLEKTLQLDAKFYCENLVKLTDFIMHDLVVYKNAASENFVKHFKRDPLNKTIVENYIANYIPEKSRFSSKSLNNSDLSLLVEHQNKIIALDKLGNKKEPITSLSLEELKLILTIPDMKNKYDLIFSSAIQKIETEVSKAASLTSICRKIGFFAVGAASGVALACSIAYGYHSHQS